MESNSLSIAAAAVVVCALLLLEWASPWRRAAIRVEHRWLTNIGLMLLGGILVAAIFPFSAEQAAAGIRNGWIAQWQLPPLLEVLLVFLLLDGWRYWEHRIYHEVPLLWRVHLVHHSDTALDITTAQRHHPLEAIAAVCTTLLLVFALGFSAQALAVYVALATLSALFTHANIVLPETIDRPLRRWLVTPAVHAIHHSDLQSQTDSNYGAVLTLWDRLFGTYKDPADVRIPHFGLEYFHRPADTALAPVLLQPFEYRRGMVYPARDDTGPQVAPVVRLSDAWKQALRQSFIGLTLAVLALWPTMLGLAGIWANSEAYQYAWLVIPMFVYTVGWYHRDWILAMTPRPDGLGLLVSVVAVVCWCVAYVVDIRVGQHLALVLVLQGIALSALGWTTYRRLLPVMAMLFMLVPSGDMLQPLLRDLTVKWIEWFAVALDLPHRIDGFMVYIGEQRYVVVDACSGLTFVTLGGFLAYSLGVLMFRSFGRVLLMAAMGAVIGVFTNALRVWLIVGIDHLQGSQMDMAAHQDLQWLALFTGIGLLFFLTLKLAPRDQRSVPAPVPQPPSAVRWRITRFAPALAGLMVLLAIVPVQNLAARANSDTGDLLQELARLHPGSEWPAEPQVQLKRMLVIPRDHNMDVVLVDAEGDRGRVDESLLDPGTGGDWRHASTDRYRECIPQMCFRFVHKTWRRKGSDEARHALYVYYVGDTVTDSALAYRLTSGWRRLVGSAPHSGLIGFRLQGDLPEEPLLAQTLGQLMAELRQVGRGDTVSADLRYGVPGRVVPVASR
ncbi:MAG TPA: archaeosortase/exosortase family protein [Gammaproteobacteria bacterium]|nr:archaeosortase/exosortase family protein [Gammaproteobacteria bacterium]